MAFNIARKLGPASAATALLGQFGTPFVLRAARYARPKTETFRLLQRAATTTTEAGPLASSAAMVRWLASANVVGVDQAQAAAQQEVAYAGEAEGPLRPARAEDVTALLSYALRFGLDGKPRRAASDFLAPLAAAQIYQHMERAGLVILQQPATQPHPSMG